MVIDVHGHFTSPPAALDTYRASQFAVGPKGGPFDAGRLTDEAIVQALERRQLPEMRRKGVGAVVLSPAAYAMGHHVGTSAMVRNWTAACNALIERAVRLFPDQFVGSCQLPQAPGSDPHEWLDELELRVVDQGFVGCIINPDISGGLAPMTPSVADEWWFPLYSRLEQLGVPAFFHASATHNPAFHFNGTNYTAWDHACAFDLLWSWEQIRAAFPNLEVIISHGGGAFLLQYNRMRALFDRAGKDYDGLVRAVNWDLAVYEPETMKVMLDRVGPERLLYSSEMCGTADVTDRRTGRKFDDTLTMVSQLSLTDAELELVLGGNARRVFRRASFVPSPAPAR